MRKKKGEGLGDDSKTFKNLMVQLCLLVLIYIYYLVACKKCIWLGDVCELDMADFILLLYCYGSIISKVKVFLHFGVRPSSIFVVRYNLESVTESMFFHFNHYLFDKYI